MERTDQSILDAYRALVEIGIAVSRREDIDSLLETILLAAKRLARADGGTLYLVEQEGQLGTSKNPSPTGG